MQRALPFLLLLVTCAPTPAPEAMPPTATEVGAVVHGFELKQTHELPELGARGLYFVHKKSGAQLIKLESADPNKVFAVAFKTPPESDTGLPHILEHSVLAGSKSFPVKNPFEILLQGSLHTFLNAFTGDDFTMYPVASTNDKDFKNLMHVYLDAVFFPLITEDERIFEQEGWRFELESRDAPLEYNGVVYSEMKGAFSSPERILIHNIARTLFPNHPYGYESGGLPEAIVEITRKDFLAFHDEYCHPSNAYVYLYGNGDTARELAFIDAEYLSKFERRDQDIHIDRVPAFAEPVIADIPYPAASTEKTAHKTYLSMSWVVGGAAQPGETFLLEVLADALVNLPGAPVREALVEAGIGGDYSASYDDSKQGVFRIIVEKADAADRDRFHDIVTQTLTDLTEAGLDRRQVDGIINSREFSLREADYGGFPKGIVYALYGSRGWLFSDDPFLTFGFEKTLAAAKKAVTAGRLETIIREGLLGNNHAALVTVYPKPGMQERLQEQLKEKLASIKAGLSDADLDALVKQSAALKQWQKTPDPPELVAKVPMLSLDDLDATGKPKPLHELTVSGTRVLHAPQTTSGIAYVKQIFSLRTVPATEVAYATLLKDLLGELSTSKHSYRQLSTEINIQTGGVRVDLEVFPSFEDPNQYRPSLVVSGKALTPKVGELLEIQAEIATSSLLDDRDRLRDVLMQVHTRLQSYARNGGWPLARTRLGASLNPLGWFHEQTGGLTYIRFVADLATNFDARADGLVATLGRVRDQVFRGPNHVVALVGGEAELAALEKELPQFVASLPDDSMPDTTWTWQPSQHREALLSTSKVNYVLQGADYRALGFAYSPHFELLGNILSRDFLMRKVRVENGAYGARAALSRFGSATFGSYRDPNLEKTLDVFRDIPAYVKSFDVDERTMTRFIIGVIAARDKPYSPRAEGWNALDHYLMGITDEMRQQERQQILGAKPEQIRRLAPILEKVIANANLCVYGNEQLLEEKKGLFSDLTPVVD